MTLIYPLNPCNTPPSILEKTEENSGFTLIELSIVLVIVALLIGGVLVGKDLIEAAKVRSQISQIEQFNTAVNAFKVKYNCVPGDCRNAAQFGFSSRTNTTADGDGDGIAGDNLIYLNYEERLFWRDLADAKLIPYSFTGAADAVTTGQVNSSLFTTYFPPAKINSGAFVAIYTSSISDRDPNTHFTIISSTSLIFGFVQALPALTPIQAYSLDSKIDDGLPQFGKVTASSSGVGAWPSGATIAIFGATQMISGSYDSNTGGPITTATTSTNFVPASATSCYDSGVVAATYPQLYSTSINGGKGMNCTLSIKMQ